MAGLIITYARVSTEDQGRTGYSLPEQIRLCRVKAGELASTLDAKPTILEFQDEMSGEILERPGLQAALELIRRQDVLAFVCLDPDRLARRLMHQLLLSDEIEAKSQLVFVQHDYQNDPEGQLFFQIRGAVAQFEKAKILERTARGTRGKVTAGGLPTVIHLYGYQFLVGAGKVLAAEALTPDPQESEWVRVMYRWCVDEGMGPSAIANRLNQLGVATKKGALWTHTQVRRALRNEAYTTGRLPMLKQDHKGIAVARQLTPEERTRRGINLSPRAKPPADWQYVTIEPIVPAELWQHAQEVLAGFRVGGRADHPTRVRMLTGLGRCGVCGSNLFYMNGSKIVCSSRYRHYWQPGTEPSSCTLPAKPRAKVEAAVWDQVCAWLYNPELLADASEIARARGVTPAPDGDAILSEITATEAQISAKAEEQERVGILFARSLWPSDKALPALEKVGAELTALQLRLAALRQEAPAPTPYAENPLLTLLRDPQWAQEIRAGLNDLSEGRRLELVRLAVGRYTLHPSGRGEAPDVRTEPRLG